jgi:D-galacturonate reductase
LQVGALSMVGVSGSKFPAIRQHLDQNIGGAYKDMDTKYVINLYSSTLA